MQVGALTQAEIDALLSNLGTQQTNEQAEQVQGAWKSVKPYDFRRPDKFSKEQVRALQMLHETFSRMMSNSLSARLRTMVQCNLASIDQGVYNEYVKTIPNTTILNIIAMDPLPGNMILEIGPDIGFAMIDRLLGGVGRAGSHAQAVTDIELALIKSLVGTILQDLQDTWANIAQVSPVLKEIILNPRFIQVAFQGDAVMILVFEIKLAETVGTVTICLPFPVLEPVLPQLSAQSWFISSRKNLPVDKALALETELQKVHVPISVELGSTDVSVEDLLAIQVGDVIRLDSDISSGLPIVIEDQVKYLAHPGRVGKRLAARIVEVLGDTEVEANAKQPA